MKDYLTIKEVAKKWELTTRRVQKMCADGVIPGAEKFGKSWAIPADVQKPKDGRITSGDYINWRRNSVQNAQKENTFVNSDA